MELVSNIESVIVHYKDNVPVAMTHINGRPTQFSLLENGRKETESFYEVNKQREVWNSSSATPAPPLDSFPSYKRSSNRD